MPIYVRRFLAIAIVAALAGPAFALECPVPQPLTRPGILQETPAQITALSNLLAGGDVGNTIPVIVADLRARYPGIENAEIINYLMAAYCPIVAQLSGLNGPAEAGENGSVHAAVGAVDLLTRVGGMAVKGCSERRNTEEG